MIFIYAVKSKADGNCVVDSLHKYVVKVSHFLTKSSFINGSNLFEENNGVLDKPVLFGVNIDMSRQLCFPELTCDGSGDYSRAILVSDIVLYNQNGTKTALFAAYDRTEICIINISAFNGQFDSLSLFHTFGGPYLPSNYIFTNLYHFLIRKTEK